MRTKPLTKVLVLYYLAFGHFSTSLRPGIALASRRLQRRAHILAPPGDACSFPLLPRIWLAIHDSLRRSGNTVSRRYSISLL